MANLLVLVALWLLPTMAFAAWREEVNGTDGVSIASRVVQFDVDDNGELYVAQTTWDSSRRGMVIVRRVSNGAATTVYNYTTSTVGAGCTALLSVRNGKRLLYTSCGSSDRKLHDLDSGSSVSTAYLNQPMRMIYDGNGLFFLTYAALQRYDSGNITTVFGNGTSFTCDSSSSSMPLANSMAILDKTYFAETSCYGIGSIWRLNGNGVERLTSFIGSSPTYGRSILGTKIQSPVIDGRGMLLAVLDRGQSTVYLVNHELLVTSVMSDVPISSGSFARVILGPRRVYVLDVQREAIYSSAIPGLPEPTDTPTVAPTPTVGQPTNTPVPTATSGPSGGLQCPQLVCGALQSAIEACGCGAR